MNDLLCWLKRKGRPRIERERDRMEFKIEVDLHKAVLTLAGQAGLSQNDMLNILIAVGLPLVSCHPEIIPTFHAKFSKPEKKPDES